MLRFVLPSSRLTLFFSFFRTSIQASTNIILTNLSTVTITMGKNTSLLERIAVHPSTNFPGRQHEAILLQLLRKKPEPAVETLLDEGRQLSQSLGGDGGASKAAAWTAQRALWRWAQEYCDGRIAQYAQEETLQVYTAEERASGVENVRTGLRASLEDEEDDEDEDGEDDEDDEDDDDGRRGGGGEGGEKDAKTRAADAKEAARVAKEKEEAKARRAAGMKLARNMVVGRFETPPNADWEAKRKLIGAGIGVARAPGR